MWQPIRHMIPRVLAYKIETESLGQTWWEGLQLQKSQLAFHTSNLIILVDLHISHIPLKLSPQSQGSLQCSGVRPLEFPSNIWTSRTSKNENHPQRSANCQNRGPYSHIPQPLLSTVPTDPCDTSASSEEHGCTQKVQATWFLYALALEPGEHWIAAPHLACGWWWDCACIYSME
jgi:hypothetical protein